MGFQRTPLVQVSQSILSSYDANYIAGGPREGLLPLARSASGYAPPEVCRALEQAHRSVLNAGGDFRITELRRSTVASAAARTKYERWLAAGKPAPGTPGWNGRIMKNAYVARPGRSMHNSGRAIDVHLEVLNLPVAPELQLDTLWNLLQPLGWSPIIKTPTEGTKESWHFDYWGEWRGVYDRLGYEQAAMACALDTGLDCYDRWSWRFVQAQLQRAGYDIGDIDGYAGRKTREALRVATGSDPEHTVVAALPSSQQLIWSY